MKNKTDSGLLTLLIVAVILNAAAMSWYYWPALSPFIHDPVVDTGLGCVAILLILLF